MRSGIWTLAVCGIVGLISSAGTADDQLFQRGFFGQTLPSRFRRSSASDSAQTKRPAKNDHSAPRVKNYFRGLFGSAPPTRLPNSAQSTTKPAPSGSPIKRIEQIGHREPSRKESAVPLRRIPFDSDSTKSANVEPPPFAKRDRPQRDKTVSKPANRAGSEWPLFDNPERLTNNPNPFNLSKILQTGHTRNSHASGNDRVQQAQAAAKSIDAQPDSSFRTTARSVRSGAATGNTPTVSLAWVKRSDISVGQECSFLLVVQNGGRVVAEDLLVEAYFPKSVRLTNADPVPTESQDHLSWNVASLAPGQEKMIHISMIPSRPGELAMKALVRFTGSASGLFTVTEPLLKVTVQGPQEVMLGDPASQIITVSNPGSGVARAVEIETTIPPGLEHAHGKRVVTKIGSLNPGESRKIRLALAAVDGGEHQLLVEARAGAALRQVVEARITVTAPKLSVTITGPGLRYKNRTARYQLTVRNDGSGVTDNVRVMHKLPDGFDFRSADKGGKFDSVNKTVSWFIGQLDAGESAQVQVELTATKLGSFVHHASAFSEHAPRTDAQVETRVDGTASLVLEIVDLDDPVEIGAATAYEVRIRNEGTKGANNVGLSCELPGGVELIGAKAPAEHLTKKGLVVFKSLAELAPGKTAIYRIQVRGTLEGNQRFRARLTSDSIQEPLIFEELTKFYKD